MAHFVRAMEVHSFSSEKRHYVVKVCASLIEQHAIIREAGQSVYQQVEPIEEFFKVVAEFPELISRYPRFRNVCRYKIDEITEKLNSKNMPIPNIIEDMPTILKLLENRSDYVKDALLRPAPTHSYNLRPRK